MPFNIGPGELIIVLIIALIVVGPGKLPDVGSALGKSIREFRKAATDVKETTSLDPKAAPAPAPTPAVAAPVAQVAAQPEPEPVAAGSETQSA
jgi:sec-independent protein translocase protein TatA